MPKKRIMPYNKNHLPPIKLHEYTGLKVPLSNLEIKAVELAKRYENIARVAVNRLVRKNRG
jgi:hypothetical protein